MFIAGIFVGVGVSFVGATIGYFWAQYNYARDMKDLGELPGE